MSLIYDGFLNTEVADSIKSASKNYNEVIEISSLPPNWSDWAKDNLIDYNLRSENCMGQSYVKKTKMYSIVSRWADKDQPLFLFFKTAKEKNAVAESFPELVVNLHPFKTIV